MQSLSQASRRNTIAQGPTTWPTSGSSFIKKNNTSFYQEGYRGDYQKFWRGVNHCHGATISQFPSSFACQMIRSRNGLEFPALSEIGGGYPILDIDSDVKFANLPATSNQLLLRHQPTSRTIQSFTSPRAQSSGWNLLVCSLQEGRPHPQPLPNL